MGFMTTAELMAHHRDLLNSLALLDKVRLTSLPFPWRVTNALDQERHRLPRHPA
ncbi:MAG: hypothetical protein ACKVIS_17375 [Pseudomonadales bacterium]